MTCPDCVALFDGLTGLLEPLDDLLVIRELLPEREQEMLLSMERRILALLKDGARARAYLDRLQASETTLASVRRLAESMGAGEGPWRERLNAALGDDVGALTLVVVRTARQVAKDRMDHHAWLLLAMATQVLDMRLHLDVPFGPAILDASTTGVAGEGT